MRIVHVMMVASCHISNAAILCTCVLQAPASVHLFLVHVAAYYSAHLSLTIMLQLIIHNHSAHLSLIIMLQPIFHYHSAHHSLNLMLQLMLHYDSAHLSLTLMLQLILHYDSAHLLIVIRPRPPYSFCLQAYPEGSNKERRRAAIAQGTSHSAKFPSPPCTLVVCHALSTPNFTTTISATAAACWDSSVAGHHCCGAVQAARAAATGA